MDAVEGDRLTLVVRAVTVRRRGAKFSSQFPRCPMPMAHRVLSSTRLRWEASRRRQRCGKTEVGG